MLLSCSCSSTSSAKHRHQIRRRPLGHHEDAQQQRQHHRLCQSVRGVGGVDGRGRRSLHQEEKSRRSPVSDPFWLGQLNPARLSVRDTTRHLFLLIKYDFRTLFSQHGGLTVTIMNLWIYLIFHTVVPIEQVNQCLLLVELLTPSLAPVNSLEHVIILPLF